MGRDHDIEEAREHAFICLAKEATLFNSQFLKRVLDVSALDRIAILRWAVILGLLTGFAISPKLWLSSRLYPLTPVWRWIRPFSPPADILVFSVLIGLLILIAFHPYRTTWTAAFILLLLLSLQDQSRWQPWFYQYVAILAVLAIAPREREQAVLNTGGLVLAATYFWSGLGKLNPNFMNEIFPAMVRPLIGSGLAGTRLIHYFSLPAALLECGTGIGFLCRRFRNLALVSSAGMHLFVLLSLGPMGNNFNPVIWPWNVVMIIFSGLFFFRRKDKPSFRDIVWGRKFGLQRPVLILFALMPALSFFNRWDHYLSAGLYTGNANHGYIYMTDSVYDKLPDEFNPHISDEGANLNGIDINNWSFRELHVPAYPEYRIFENIARQICDYSPDGSGVQLVIEGQRALVNSRRRSVFSCSALRASAHSG